MQALTINSKQKLTLILLSILSTAFINPAIAKSDKQMMGEVQRAMGSSKQHDAHKRFAKLNKGLKFYGVFYGYLPCDDCDGIKTTLSLKIKNNYLLVTQYAKTSTREYYEKGKYVWDEKNKTVTLTSKKDSKVRTYHIKNEGVLVLKTLEGVVIQSNDERYALTRGDKTKSREVHIH